MAIDEGYSRSEVLPPNYLAQFYQGAGEGVPGIMPLLNQDLYNKMQGFGVAGANPYTYQGQRIADFTPAQQEGMRLSAEGVGSYSPYLDRSEAITEGSLADATQGYDAGAQLFQGAVDRGTAGIGEGQEMLRGAVDLGAGAMGAFRPEDIAPFANQYTEDVVDQSLRDVTEKMTSSDIFNRAMGLNKGAGFGSRSGEQRSQAIQDIGRGALKGIGSLRMGAQDRAADLAQSSFNNQQARQADQARFMGQSAGGLGAFGGALGDLYGGAGRDVSGMGFQMGQLGANLGAQIGNIGGAQQGLMGTDIARLYGMGGMQQGQDQRGLDLDYGNFVGAYNLPGQTIGQAGSMATGFAPAMGGTTLGQTSTGRTTNPLMQAAGTGIAAYGALKGGSGGQPQRRGWSSSGRSDYFGGRQGGGQGGGQQQPSVDHMGPRGLTADQLTPPIGADNPNYRSGGQPMPPQMLKYIDPHKELIDTKYSGQPMARPDWTPNQLITDQKQWTPRDEKPQDTAYGPPKGWTPQGGGQPQDSGVWSGPGHEAIQLPASFKQKQWGGVTGRAR